MTELISGMIGLAAGVAGAFVSFRLFNNTLTKDAIGFYEVRLKQLEDEVSSLREGRVTQDARISQLEAEKAVLSSVAPSAKFEQLVADILKAFSSHAKEDDIRFKELNDAMTQIGKLALDNNQKLNKLCKD